MITFDRAVEIAKHCAKALEIAGLQADVAYSKPQLCEALAAYKLELEKAKEDVILANRRYAAANARATKLAGKAGPVDLSE